MMTQPDKMEREKRKVFEGWVVSDKMNKSRVIEIRWSKRDAQYEKVRNVKTKVCAHDEKNESHLGDRVLIMETRPLSKTKRWRVVDILDIN